MHLPALSFIWCCAQLSTPFRVLMLMASVWAWVGISRQSQPKSFTGRNVVWVSMAYSSMESHEMWGHFHMLHVVLSSLIHKSTLNLILLCMACKHLLDASVGSLLSWLSLMPVQPMSRYALLYLAIGEFTATVGCPVPSLCPVPYCPILNASASHPMSPLPVPLL